MKTIKILTTLAIFALIFFFKIAAISATTTVCNTSEVKIHSAVPKLAMASFEELQAEPQLDYADIKYAESRGGPLTRLILEKLSEILSPEIYSQLRIDSKVHRLESGWLANDPGWHCDFFAGYDKSVGHLEQVDEVLSNKTRHFLIVSGDPATEFLYQRNLPIDLGVSSWQEISNSLDATVAKANLFSIPKAYILEFKGDEIHRAVPYRGKEPTVRYLLRASYFPEGHSENGSYHNTVRERRSFIPTQEEKS